MLFVVVLDEPNDEVAGLIKEKYSECYEFSDTVFLVSQDSLAETIAQEIKIKGENRLQTAIGAVFKLNGAYAGYASRSLWEWLEKMEKSSGG